MIKGRAVLAATGPVGFNAPWGMKHQIDQQNGTDVVVDQLRSSDLEL